MKKRILSTLLALCMVLTLLPENVLAAGPTNGTCGDNLRWVLDDSGVLTISGSGPTYGFSSGSSPTATTPPPWYAQRSNIEMVIVEEGVTIIWNWAFENCENLTKVVLSDSLTNLGMGVFANCASLRRIVLPEGITEISYSLFEGCSSLNSVYLPNSLRAIGERTICACTGLILLTVRYSQIFT